MPSSREEGTASAAEQLGSMSLGESVERKDDNKTNPTEKNGTNTKKLCSACGKKSDALKKCNGCKCVWYCDKKCQNKHRKEHKHECRPIKKVLDERGGKFSLGTEEDVGPLGKVPQREECPICMRVLPLHAALHMYFACCGKSVCLGCDRQHGIKNKEQADTCAFCRTEHPESDEEILVRLRKRVERKDPKALHSMSSAYGYGRYGLLVDQAKCVDLLRKSAGLGYPVAQSQLGNLYDDGDMGLEQSEEEALKYWEKAAKGGHVISRHNLGCTENKNGDVVAAMDHWRLSASGGSKDSIKLLIVCFEDGFLRHGDLAETLQAMYLARAEMKSGERDEYIKHLKMIGEYKEEYDL